MEKKWITLVLQNDSWEKKQVTTVSPDWQWINISNGTYACVCLYHLQDTVFTSSGPFDSAIRVPDHDANNCYKRMT